MGKTCILKVEGIFYSEHLKKDIILDTISDKDAIFLLSKNVLREKHFIVLPENYKATGLIYTKKELKDAIKRNSRKELNLIAKDLKLISKPLRQIKASHKNDDYKHLIEKHINKKLK
jgi:hypothetical protein